MATQLCSGRRPAYALLEDIATWLRVRPDAFVSGILGLIISTIRLQSSKTATATHAWRLHREEMTRETQLFDSIGILANLVICEVSLNTVSPWQEYSWIKSRMKTKFKYEAAVFSRIDD